MDEIAKPCAEKVLSYPTAPPNFSINLRNFDTEKRAADFGRRLGEYINGISRHLDLSKLDGVTIAYDYRQALVELDRGYVTTHKLTPSDSHAIGVAMTPTVIRDSEVKSHIVLNANLMIGLDDPENENFGLALHILFHECAHVEITDRFNQTFPGTLLERSYKNAHEALRWQIIMACWDEYAATNLSARYGQEQTKGYEDTFLQILVKAKPTANQLISAYRTHASVDQILAEIYGVYGELLKFAAYHLGNMNGLGLVAVDLPRTNSALTGHWFASHFEKLRLACEEIASHYGDWKNKDSFEIIGNLVDEIVAEGGMHVTILADGRLYVEVPFSPETMPHGIDPPSTLSDCTDA